MTGAQLTLEERRHRQNMYSQAYALRHRKGPYSKTCIVCGAAFVSTSPVAKTCRNPECKRRHKNARLVAWRASRKGGQS